MGRFRHGDRCVRGRRRPGRAVGGGVRVQRAHDPADDGFFGPGSVTWRVSGDLSSSWPGCGRCCCRRCTRWPWPGVDQHSDWRRDPVGQAGRHLRLPGHDQLRRPGGGRAGRGPGAPDPRARPRHRPGDRPAVRGRRSRAAAVGARDPGRVGHRGRRAVRHAAVSPRTATATWRRWWSRPNSSACPADLVPASVAGLAAVPHLGPARAALHARGRGVHGLPARPARAWTRTSRRSGRTSGTARSPRCRTGRREMYGYHAAPLTDGPPDRDPAGARRARRGVPRRARGARGAAADRPADARGAARMRTAPASPRARIRRARSRRAGAGRGRGAAPGASAAGPCIAGRATAGSGCAAGWPRCSWPRAAGRATRAARRGCSRRRASTGSSCATTWPCRPPRTSPPPWAR